MPLAQSVGKHYLGPMARLDDNVNTFIQLLKSGESLRAMQEFYHEEVVVFENRELARAGLRRCLDYERTQLATQPTPPSFKLTSHAVNPATGHVFLEYMVRFAAPNGRPLRLDEVAVQKWEGDKIVEERFYYEGVVDEGDDTDADNTLHSDA